DCAEHFKELRRVDFIDRFLPELGRNMVLQRSDPLRRVLAAARRLHDSLMVVTCTPGKGSALYRNVRCSGFFPGLGIVTSTFVDRIDTAPQLVTRVRSKRSCRGDALSCLRRVAAVACSQAHFAPLAGRSRESEDEL